MPERYREAVVLCYLEGHTCEDAARILGWPVGTVKSRLSRARERLRARLSRPSLPSAYLPDEPQAIPPLPPRLSQATVGLAVRFGAGTPAPASAAGAVALAEGVLKMMTLAKWKYAATALLAAASWPVIASALAPPGALPDPPKLPVEAARPGPQDPPKALDPLAQTTPLSLAARAGNGTARLYSLDDKKDRILKDGTPKAVGQYGPWKEVDVPLRWVIVTGVVDNRAVREALAWKVDLADTYPDYKRVEIERQVRRPGGDWSDWGGIDRNKDYDVLDNLPEISQERMPEEVRPPALIDPLPVLTKGTWSGVDPEPILRLPKPEPDQIIGQRRLYQSPLLAIRVFNFAVEPGMTYRYRLRVLLKNPDVAQDGKKELFGPWSEPTKDVTVP